MWIERLQVEPEGFLRDLDVEFVPGLNVIIGARGTGKTSIVARNQAVQSQPDSRALPPLAPGAMFRLMRSAQFRSCS